MQNNFAHSHLSFLIFVILKNGKGGINFLALGIYSLIDGGLLDNGRKIACTVAFCLSRAWLLLFLAWRAHERKGDSRFDDVKDKFGTFLLYWMVQGT